MSFSLLPRSGVLSSVVVAAMVASCGRSVLLNRTDESAAGGAGAAASSSSSTTASSPSSGKPFTTSSASSSSSSAGCPSQPVPPLSACSPDASCPSASSPCLAAAPQASASVFGLRIAHLSIVTPTPLASGKIGSSIVRAVTPAVPTCNLRGTGTFSWLLRFDVPSGILTTGGATPHASASAPYTLVDTSVTLDSVAFQVSPIDLLAAFGDCTVDSGPGDVVLPVYLDAMGADVLYLPLHGLRFGNIALWAENSCIGAYDAAGLDPANQCAPDHQHPLFVDGGRLSAHFLVAEADRVPVGAIGASLCVLLSGDAQLYGDGAQPIAHCKQGPNHEPLFRGDWCHPTDQPASAACHDAVRFDATFAASGVNID
jgi:hypothetical protein